jgi:phosphopantothenoylcysteine decarboxylase/phosphopantothenate--cysteine ligase
LAEQAELLCVAPATANFLAKAACGLADDLLSTLTLSFSGKILVAPAMNCEMWAKAAVQRNVDQLRRDGIVIIDPEEGWLSCRKRGAGRMASPEKIREVIAEQLAI